MTVGSDCTNFGVGVECVGGTCGWSCVTDADCTGGNVNPGNNQRCYRGMCTCYANPPAGPADVLDTSRSFICGGGAPCGRLTHNFPPLIDYWACMIPPASESSCATESALIVSDNCPTWTTSYPGHFLVGGSGANTLFIVCGAYPVVYSDYPCPIGMRSHPSLTLVPNPIRAICADVPEQNCCFCGDEEWTDPNQFCSRTSFNWFECVKDTDCPMLETCSYDPNTDYGTCI